MQRGFTLVELTIATGIVALLAAGGALALGAHPMASSTGFAQLRAQIAAATALARASGDGATVVVTAAGNGFHSVVYSGRPDGTPSVAQIAPVDSPATLTEASIGAPPFAVFISSAGDFSAAPGAAPGGGSEPACPARGDLELQLADASGGQHTLALPCRQSALGSPEPIPTNGPVP